ncbi:MAG: response regulator [Gammaproteobacteria bacterium]|nr:MAG: response regulator [Gammaproteobacteria bacterium]
MFGIVVPGKFVSSNILIVEDERELRTTLRDALLLEGYKVFTAASLSEGIAIAANARNTLGALDLILLDLGLPDGDGETLLLQLRKQYNIPVIVISARESESQKIHLLDVGADDYLVKPFGIGELLARMRVALRHKGLPVNAAITTYSRCGVVVDLSARYVARDGEKIHLTPTEFNLLARLVRSAGRVVTHRQLLNDVWGAEYIDHTHYLRLYMTQLRAKLELNSADPVLLLTEPGVGYRLAHDA